MSFILDALKKSEAERQRQSGPALFEVKVAPPRSRFAVWAAGVGALLAINVVVVGWVLWREGASRAANAPQATAQAGAAATGTTPSPAGFAMTTLAGTSAYQGYPGSVPNVAGAGVPYAGGDGTPAGTLPPGTASGAGYARADSADAGVNPDDLAPAVEPRRQATPSAGDPSASGVIRATASGLPTYQDAAAEPGANIPELRLDLHVYSPQPDQRFVFLNMMKLHEGESTPKGVRIERITQDGVILSYRGKEFVLLKP